MLLYYTRTRTHMRARAHILFSVCVCARANCHREHIVDMIIVAIKVLLDRPLTKVHTTIDKVQCWIFKNVCFGRNMCGMTKR